MSSAGEYASGGRDSAYQTAATFGSASAIPLVWICTAHLLKIDSYCVKKGRRRFLC